MKFTFDPIALGNAILLILLMAGVIPFTPFWVGLLILLTYFGLKFEFGGKN